MFMRQLNIRIEEALYRRIRILAARLGVSQGSLTADMLEYALIRFESAEDAKEERP